MIDKMSTVSKFIYLILLCTISGNCRNAEIKDTLSKRIIIELELSEDFTNPRPANFILKDILEIQYLIINRIDYTPLWYSAKSKVSKLGSITWTIYANSPIQVNYGFGELKIVSPGDSIHIKYIKKDPLISGRGADKLNALSEMLNVEEELKKPSNSISKIGSIGDYLRWNNYLDQKLALQIPILESHRNKIQPFEYNYLKSFIVSLAENLRINAFIELEEYSRVSTSEI